MHLANPADLSADHPFEQDWRLATDPETNPAMRSWVSQIGSNPRQTLLAYPVCEHSLTLEQKKLLVAGHICSDYLVHNNSTIN